MKSAMADKSMKWVLIFLCVMYVLTVEAKSEAPTMAPAPSMDCMTPIYNMSDCLTYVEQGSNASKPDKACCPELAGLLESNPICLCHLLGKSTDFPISLDINRALKLPKVCRLQAPPVSMCSAIGIPVGAPTSSAPTSSASSASGMAPTQPAAVEGSPSENGASRAYTNLSYMIGGLAIASTLLSTL